MKTLILAVMLLLNGCASNDYLIAGGALAVNIALAQVEQKHEGNKSHTGHAFALGAMLANLPTVEKGEANLACAVAGTGREVYKHYFKEVKFSAKDAGFNIASCMLGSNFTVQTNDHEVNFGYQLRGVF